MVSYMFSYMLALLLILGGNRDGSDILDTLPTALYWQVKKVEPTPDQLRKDAGPDAPVAAIDQQLKDLQSENFQTREKAQKELEAMGPAIRDLLRPAMQSPDPEISAVASALVKRFDERSQERAIRRLMAIRTLGESKDPAALPTLNTLVDSKELFVANYARRAIAQINGQPHPRPDLAPRMTADLALLPPDAALFVQSTGVNSESLNLATLVDKVMEGVGGDMGPGGAKPDKKAALNQIASKLIQLLERTGNMRIDGISVGINLEGDDDNNGWAMVVFRGEYHADLLYAALHEATGEPGAPWYEPGAVPMISDGDEMSILFPSNEHLVMIAGSDALYTRPAQTRVLAALQAKQNEFRPTSAMQELLKSVDQKSPFWAAGILSKGMTAGEWDSISKIVVNSKATPDGVDLTLTATGEDAAKIKQQVDDLNQSLNAAIMQIGQQLPANPKLKPASDLMTSIKITALDKQATLTVQFKKGLIDLVLGEVGPMFLGELISEPAREVVPR